MDEKDLKIYDGTVMPEKKELIPQQSMIQMRSERCVAMIVPKPRNLQKIESDVLQEAKYALHDFYYNWSINDRKNKRKAWIEGGTIGLAQAMYRAWNNCELVTSVNVEFGYWIFNSTFFDFENGSTINREHRVRIPQIDANDSDYERKMDAKFQAWYSKNQRNTIFAALPRWLKNKGIDAAKLAAQNELKGSQKEKLMKALDFFKGKGISQENIFSYFDKERIEDFDITDVVRVCNIANQLYNGEINVDDILKQVQEDFEEKAKQQKKEQPKLEPKKEQSKVDSSKSERTTPNASKQKTEHKVDHRETSQERRLSNTDDTVKNENKANADEMENMFKSLMMRGISEIEICAFFYCENLSEIGEQSKDDLKHIVTEIESEKMSIEQFKIDAAERLTMKIEMDKKK